MLIGKKMWTLLIIGKTNQWPWSGHWLLVFSSGQPRHQLPVPVESVGAPTALPCQRAILYAGTHLWGGAHAMLCCLASWEQIWHAALVVLLSPCCPQWACAWATPAAPQHPNPWVSQFFIADKILGCLPTGTPTESTAASVPSFLFFFLLCCPSMPGAQLWGAQCNLPPAPSEFALGQLPVPAGRPRMCANLHCRPTATKSCWHARHL